VAEKSADKLAGCSAGRSGSAWSGSVASRITPQYGKPLEVPGQSRPLVGLTWFLLSIRRGWSGRPRLKAELYRFVDDVGRWSVLDPFTVMVFTPMVQLGQLGHFRIMGGVEAFLATVALSMLAARALDPRLIWDVAGPGVAASVGPSAARAAAAP
jgi:hypothetical protein